MALSLLGKRDVSVAAQKAEFIQNVLDYVRNNIDTEFRYGLSKGGRGALIDQSGTPFDQAELMVMLLRRANVTANYVYGEITLTPTQFGLWTGLVKDLDEANQTFTVDAKSACQLLADGGIPATVNGSSNCASVSGNLSTVVLTHLWVQANGILYDPSYKAYTLRNGIDLPSAMGCGSEAASTCGSLLKTAIVSGSNQGSVSAIPYIELNNLTAAGTTLAGYKGNLTTAIKSQNINGQGVNASIFDVLGGRKLGPQSNAIVLPTYTQRGTWTGNIPDQFRTKLDVNTGACGSFFADEISSRSLVYKSLYQGANFFALDDVDLAALSYQPAEACSNVANPYYQIAVNHPYAANSGAYADEVINFKPVDPPTDEVGYFRPFSASYLYSEQGAGITPAPNLTPTDNTSWPEQNYLSGHTITIIHEFGRAHLSAQKHMTDLVAVMGPKTDKCELQTSTILVYRECHIEEQAVVAETFAAIRTLVDDLVDGVNKTVSTRHHDLGIIYAGRSQGLSIMTLQESLSVAPKSGLSTDQQASFDSHSLLLAEAEARSNAIDGAEGLSAARDFFWGGKRIYDVAPSKMSTYLALLPNQPSILNGDGTTTRGYNCIKYLTANGTSLGPDGCWRKMAMQDVADQGYSTLIAEGGMGELLYKGSSERAFTMWEYVKGGATIGDALSTAQKSTEVQDEAALRRKSLAVSQATGALQFSAQPDIVTGTGEFPFSLSFTRSYTPTYKEMMRSTSTYSWGGGGAVSTNSTAKVSSGPDSQYHDRLGGGWTHNFQVLESWSDDLTYGLGSENAFYASELIATIRVIKDLGATSDLASKVGSIYALNNISRTYGSYDFNTVMVRAGAKSVTFHKTYDGAWFSAQNPNAKIAYVLNAQNRPIGSKYTSENGEVINFSPYRYDEISINPSGQVPVTDPATEVADLIPYVKLFKADSWVFPNGARINFNYTGTTLSSGANCTPYYGQVLCGPYSGQYGYLLSSVTNNLGHTLNFNYVKQGVRQQMGTTQFFSYALTSVSDETGRSVSFDNGGSFNGDYFKVTDVRGKVTRYEYTAGTDSPDPTTVVRDNYQLRRWFTPGNTLAYQTIKYDDVFRVSKVTDRNGHFQTWYPSGMFGAELWKRTELVDGEGNVSLTLFDDKNGDFYSKTPMGRITTKTFDNLSHPLRTVMPEGNAVEQTYDVRGNVLRVCKISKARAGLPCDEASTDIVTKTAYKEGPTVLSCVNSVICDKPASETDAMGKVTNYTWDATTGNLTQILLPADRTGVRPQTDASYTPCLGVSLLTSKTEKISSSQSVVTAYTNDAANHCVLKQVVTDSGGANLTTALTFDAVGNLTSVDGPLSGTADTTTYQWEPDRRIKAVISPDPDATGVMLRKEVKYTYNDDRWITQTDTGTATGADGTGFTIVTSEKPTFDLMGNKIQSKVVKP